MNFEIWVSRTFFSINDVTLSQRLSGSIFDRKMLHYILGFWKLYRAFKGGGMLLFYDFVALYHVVPLTGSNLFTYNSGRGY
jgi:hypothetical protein